MNITKLWWFIRTKIVGLEYGHVGSQSYIGKPIFIQRKKNIFIGNKVRIYSGMRAELTQKTAEIHIKDNVSIGQNFHVVCYKGKLEIGKDTTISGNVFISNVDHNYREIGVHVLEQDMLESPTQIGENCFIGYGAVIMPGTTLGRQCIVGVNSVVKGSFPDFCVIAGSPAKIVRKFNFVENRWEKMGNE